MNIQDVKKFLELKLDYARIRLSKLSDEINTELYNLDENQKEEILWMCLQEDESMTEEFIQELKNVIDQLNKPNVNYTIKEYQEKLTKLKQKNSIRKLKWRMKNPKPSINEGYTCAGGNNKTYVGDTYDPIVDKINELVYKVNDLESKII